MTTDHPAGIEIPDALYNPIKALVLQCALAALIEDDAERQRQVGDGIAAIISAGPELSAACLGYLSQFADGITRGYGSKDAARAEIERVLDSDQVAHHG